MTIISTASGASEAISEHMPVTTDEFFTVRSVRDIPGILGKPAVTTITEESAASTAEDPPLTIEVDPANARA